MWWKKMNVGKKVEWLFNNILKSDGSQYTHQEVEEGTEKLEYKVTATAIWKIRNHKTRNPGYLTLHALASFFNVPPTFFFSEDELSEEEVTKINNQTILNNPQVHEIALHASKLDQKGLQMILNLMRYIDKVKYQANKVN